METKPRWRWGSIAPIIDPDGVIGPQVFAVSRAYGAYCHRPLWLHAESVKMRVPCRTCGGCMVQKARAWVARSLIEAESCNDRAWLVTGTFAVAPAARAEVVQEAQRFLKRLRRGRREPVVTHRGPVACPPAQVRYLGGPETGSRRGRWHVHFIVFGNARWLQLRTAWQVGHLHARRLPLRKGVDGKFDAETFKGLRYVAGYVAKDTGEHGGRVIASLGYGRAPKRADPVALHLPTGAHTDAPEAPEPPVAHPAPP